MINLQVDTSLAESVLKTLYPDAGSAMTTNLVHEKFIHFSADNIGILDETAKIIFMQLKFRHGKGE